MEMKIIKQTTNIEELRIEIAHIENTILIEK